MMKTRIDWFRDRFAPAVLLAVTAFSVGLSGETEMNLDAEREFVCVPAGSAFDLLGLLFAQLEINGGVELGDLDINRSARYLSENEAEEKLAKEGSLGGRWVEVDGKRKFLTTSSTDWLAKPGDPVYFKEFLARKVKVREALDGYCKLNRLVTWKTRDNMVNMSYVNLPDKKNNLPEYKIPRIAFEEGLSLSGCLEKIKAVTEKGMKERNGRLLTRDEKEYHPVLPDYMGASRGIRLSRGMVFEGKSIREILNQLVKPFRNVVWVALQGQDEEKNESCVIHFGSWRDLEEDLVRDPWFWLEALEHSKTGQIKPVRKAALPYPRETECMLWFYLCYKDNAEDARRALSEVYERVSKGGPEMQDGRPVVDGYTLPKFKAIRDHIEKGFDEYAREVLWIQFGL